MGALLEDFGSTAPRVAPKAAAAPAGSDRFDDGYNAGWDDAMAQVARDQTRIAEQLADRLAVLAPEGEALRRKLMADLEPALRDVFDKVLPHAVDRSFLGTVLMEITQTMAAANEDLMVFVSPEDVAPMLRLLDRAALSSDQVQVAAEPALAMSQALLRWTGQERRIDLGGVLSDMDDAIDTFFATLDRGQNAADIKEAQNG